MIFWGNYFWNLETPVFIFYFFITEIYLTIIWRDNWRLVLLLSKGLCYLYFGGKLFWKSQGSIQPLCTGWLVESTFIPRSITTLAFALKASSSQWLTQAFTNYYMSLAHAIFAPLRKKNLLSWKSAGTFLFSKPLTALSKDKLDIVD